MQRIFTTLGISILINFGVLFISEASTQRLTGPFFSSIIIKLCPSAFQSSQDPIDKKVRKTVHHRKSTRHQTGYIRHQGTVHYYTNSRGHTVQSPTSYNYVPAGATALCRDGTYSFSENRRGTCSHHGGVQKWLK